MKWVTRVKARVDRIAGPWLIRRFIGAEAEVLFVPERQDMERRFPVCDARYARLARGA